MTAMKSYLKIALVALIALLPAAMLSAEKISSGLQAAVDTVVSAPTDAASFNALVAAIENEVVTQGFSNVADISEQVMKCATNKETAEVLAKALAKAIIAKAKATTGVDVNSVAFAIGAGISNGVSAAFKDDAVEAAAGEAAAIQSADEKLDDEIRSGASTKGTVPGIEPPEGDAGETPASDISTGTGVSGK